MAVGSQSAALKNSSLIDTYKIVREINPNGMILANISPEVALQEDFGDRNVRGKCTSNSY